MSDEISDQIIRTMNRVILGEVAENPSSRIINLDNIYPQVFDWIRSLPDMQWARFPNQDLVDVERNAKWFVFELERFYAHAVQHSV
jgi:hypothetical protein